MANRAAPENRFPPLMRVSALFSEVDQINYGTIALAVLVFCFIVLTPFRGINSSMLTPFL